MSTKRKRHTGLCFGQLMAMLFNLIFLTYHYHNWTITCATRHWNYQSSYFCTFL